MSNMDDELRRAVQQVSAQAKPADLLQRSLSTARRIRRLRTGAGVSATAVVVAALGVGGWSIASHSRSAGDIAPATSPTASAALPTVPSSAPPTAPASTPPTSSPSTSAAATSAAATSTPVSVPILVSQPLSTPGEDPSILHPTSCTVTGDVATATGTFGQMYEGYARVGDVVELYVYAGRPTTAPGSQEFAQLPNQNLPEAKVPMPAWKVSAPLFNVPASAHLFCLVAVQSTHAFIGAPSG